MRKSIARKAVAPITVATQQAALVDAIELLKADHRQVEGWFEQFKSALVGTQKEELALRICQALQIHMQIEEEIFYPAFWRATQAKSMHHEAEIEHARARVLMADIQASSPQDEYFDAKVSVLSEMIQHHVNEEERPDGLFAKARRSDLDLGAIGEQLAARSSQLTALAQTGAWAGRGMDASTAPLA